VRLADGSVEFSEQERWLVLRRPSIVVVVNLSDQARELSAIAPELGDLLFDSHALLHGAGGTGRHAGSTSEAAPHSVLVARDHG
jgi:hypothetical protein